MTKDKFTVRFEKGLENLFVPITKHFWSNKMKFYSNVTIMDSISLGKLAEEPKNQRAI